MSAVITQPQSVTSDGLMDPVLPEAFHTVPRRRPQSRSKIGDRISEPA
jgi:hypothetical protein